MQINKQTNKRTNEKQNKNDISEKRMKHVILNSLIFRFEQNRFAFYCLQEPQNSTHVHNQLQQRVWNIRSKAAKRLSNKIVNIAIQICILGTLFLYFRSYSH